MQDNIDRGKWRSQLLQEQPWIQELRERIRPLNRAATLAHIYRPGRAVPKEIVVQLIMQHLLAKGLRNTQKMLEKETGLSCE